MFSMETLWVLCEKYHLSRNSFLLGYSNIILPPLKAKNIKKLAAAPTALYLVDYS